ncbi:unnamed protein product [Polarella glacialis]|uniref:Phospholipase/carboxylesterase/thioesterase domain-containing protein n=1 Tax=Polarella glacialis TaxID=89957 RepID=A0A813J3K6_POLGL|nr:unnamed protein product [Polarella glacialis]
MQPALGSQHKYTVVWLHGFTCTGGDYLSMPEYFYHSLSPAGDKIDENGKKIEAKSDGSKKNRKKSEEDEEEEEEFEPWPGIKVVLPCGGMHPIIAYSGEESLGWYNYTTDHDGKKEDEFEQTSFDDNLARIHQLLDEEIAALGGDSRRVLIGGSSQGCAMAVHAALTYKGGPLAGIGGAMGHVLSSTPIPEGWVAEKGCPIFVYIGLADDTMPLSWVEPAWNRLKEAGGDVRLVTEEGVDHGDEVREGAWCRDCVVRAFDLGKAKAVDKPSQSTGKEGKSKNCKKKG